MKKGTLMPARITPRWFDLDDVSFEISQQRSTQVALLIGKVQNSTGAQQACRDQGVGSLIHILFSCLAAGLQYSGSILPTGDE